MNLLLFFALPLATILLAIVLEKILHCPILVAITFFALYLIAAFALYATGVITNLAEALIAVIVYTIIAFLTAWIVRLIRIINERLSSDENNGRSRRTSCCNQNNGRIGDNNNCENENNDLLRISCRCNNGNSQNLLTINSDCLGTESNSESNGCGCGNNNDLVSTNSGVAVSGNVIPNQSNCGRTGWIRGCYRRY